MGRIIIPIFYLLVIKFLRWYVLSQFTSKGIRRL